jgi:hypothetical protein
MKIVVDNARAYNTVVIDSTGKNVTYPSLNANYTIDGTESYVNSGWIWSKGQHHQELHLSPYLLSHLKNQEYMIIYV